MKHLKTGLLYSDEFKRHRTGSHHPESPDRISHVYRHLQTQEFFADLLEYKPALPDSEWISEIHSPAYAERVKNTCQSGASIIDSLDTGISHDSYDVACLAVGGALRLADEVMAGKIRNGFALMRPPGHHAEKEIALGFCLFNTAAVTARYLQKKHGLGKILVVDWDVHHGNGTQNVFYDDPSVFYFSVHQFPYYPGTGAADERGRGKGIGATLNVPLAPGCGDEEYLEIFREKFFPAAADFRPDFILISAGFDAHRNDPLGHMNVTREGYRGMTELVKGAAEKFCGGRIISLLEGGYNLEALAESVQAHLEELRNPEIRLPSGKAVRPKRLKKSA